MKTVLIFAGVFLVAATLAACSSSKSFDHGFKVGYTEGYGAGLDVHFQNGELVVQARHHPNAYINAEGNLRIGDDAIEVTPPERALLKDYYSESRAIADEGEATAKAGARLGVHAVGAAIKGILSGHEDVAGKSIDTQAQAVAASAQNVCAAINRLHGTQLALAARLTAFRPYQAVDRQMHCNVTTAGSSTTVTQPSSAQPRSANP